MKRIGLVLLALFARTATGGVLVVDPTGQGAHGAFLQQALDGSSPGDIVLVKPGSYNVFGAPLTLPPWSLTVVADGAGIPVTLWKVKVTGLPAGETLVMRGFEMQGGDSVSSGVLAAIEVTDCEGTVWIEGVYARGKTALFPMTKGGRGVFISECAAVFVENSLIRGGGGLAGFTFPNSIGGDALGIYGSAVSVRDTEVAGGGSATGGTAGYGAKVGKSSVAVFSGCVVRPGPFLFGSTKSYALSVSSNSTCSARDSVLETQLFTSGEPCCLGVVEKTSTPARVLEVETPTRTGQVVNIEVSGNPGDTAFLLTGSPEFVGWSPVLQGTVALASPVAGPHLLGVIPASGTLSIAMPTAPLPAASPDGNAFALQLVVEWNGTYTIESASVYAQVKAGL